EEAQELSGALERQRVRCRLAGRRRVTSGSQQRGERLANSRCQLCVRAVDVLGLEQPGARGEGIDGRVDALPAQRGREPDDDVDTRETGQPLRSPGTFLRAKLESLDRAHRALADTFLPPGVLDSNGR